MTLVSWLSRPVAAYVEQCHPEPDATHQGRRDPASAGPVEEGTPTILWKFEWLERCATEWDDRTERIKKICEKGGS